MKMTYSLLFCYGSYNYGSKSEGNKVVAEVQALSWSDAITYLREICPFLDADGYYKDGSSSWITCEQISII